MARSSDAPDQLLTFRVAGDRFALPASSVREIVRLPRITRVPHAPDGLLGVGNLRGNVLPLIALGALIGRPVATAGRVIVLEQADPVGLFVDEVSAVVDETDARLLDLAPLLAETFRHRATTTTVRSPAIGATAVADSAANELVLLSFGVGAQEYALPITQVDEIVRLPDTITLLPEADDVVVGTIAHRGALLPLLSLQHLLRLQPGDDADRRRIVIARIGRQLIGLVVDAIRSVLRVDESLIDAVPDVLSRGQAEARIQAICRLDGGRRLVSILATEHLVRADLTERLQLKKSEESETMEAGQIDGDGQQILVFQLGGQDFGVPIAVVAEVTPLPSRLTKLPKAPAFVEGVMSLRGDVIAVIDQRRRFQGEAASGSKRRVVVVALGDMRVGFVVDAVSEVLRVPDIAIRTAPSLGDDRTKIFDRIANICDGDRMILLVDPQELLDRAERDLVAALTHRDGTPRP